MNANRRLEEFILKLSIKQNEHGLFDKINEPKLTIYFNDLKISEDNSDNKSYNKLACSIIKE
jgi:hypothetical protein